MLVSGPLVRIVSFAAFCLIASLLIGGRAWGISPKPRDIVPVPDAPGQSQQYSGELDGEDPLDSFVVVPPPTSTTLPHARAARPTGEVPSGRLYVSEIFRPPIPSRT